MSDPTQGKPAYGNRVTFSAVGAVDMIRIDHLGTAGDYTLRKATVADQAKWPNEWAIYAASRPEVVADGTPIAEIPGIKGNMEAQIELTKKGIHTAELLAGLDDRSATFIDDRNGITWRDTARLLVAAKGKPDARPQMSLNTANQPRKAA